MAFDGLVASNNLADIGSATAAWNNLGAGVTYVSGVSTVTLQIVAGDIYAASGAAVTPKSDLLLLRNLSDRVQPRLTQISGVVGSGMFFRDNTLLKVNPVSSGNYRISRGVLSGTALTINGVGIGALSTSPFSGSTAVGPVRLNTIRLSTNVRWTPLMSSGTLASGVKAIPVEYGGFIMYLKAG